jgi:hypothetical protein
VIGPWLDAAARRLVARAAPTPPPAAGFTRGVALRRAAAAVTALASMRALGHSADAQATTAACPYRSLAECISKWEHWHDLGIDICNKEAANYPATYGGHGWHHDDFLCYEEEHDFLRFNIDRCRRTCPPPKKKPPAGTSPGKQPKKPAPPPPSPAREYCEECKAVGGKCCPGNGPGGFCCYGSPSTPCPPNPINCR